MSRQPCRVPKARPHDVFCSRLGVTTTTIAFLLLGLFSAPIDAQVLKDPISQPATIAEPTPATQPPAIDRLFGDWDGLRPYLEAHGLELELSYLGEAAGNVAGGTKRDAVYASQTAAQLDVDGGKLVGISGFGAHLLLINRAGRALSGSLGNDQFNSNEIYGGGGDVAVHLAYAYVDQTFAGDTLKVSAGRISPGMFFNSDPQIYCSFLNFAGCPVPRALTGGNSQAFSIEPANVWGGVLRFNASPTVYLQAGVFETTSLLGGRSGFDWSTRDDVGVTVPAEIGWAPRLGVNALPAHIKAGFYYDSSSQPDLLYNTAGGLIPLASLPARGDRGHFGVWAAVDAMLLRHSSGPNAGLTVFANYTHTDPDISPFQDLAFLGFEDKGLISSRPADSFGVQATWARQSHQLQKLQELQMSLGQSLAYGAAEPQSTELVLEAQYDAHIFRGVDLQPDIQYIVRPAATSTLHNALVFALRSAVQF